MKTFRKRGFYTPVAALYGSSAAPWTPASLGSALIAWYKADAGVYNDSGTTLATNGQSVQQWNDQSGHGYHLHQTTGISKPTYKTGILNGLPVIDADATSNAQGMLTTSQPVTLGGAILSGFAVCKITVNPGNARMLGTYDTATGGDVGSTATILIAFLGSTITAPVTYNAGNKSTGTISSGTWNQIGSIFDSAFNTMYIANVAQTAVAAINTFASSVDIEVLAQAGNTSGSTGQIAECLFTNTVISSTDRGNLATYFFNRWGI